MTSIRPRPAALFALGLVTALALAYQIVITRLFSAVLAYHFSFLAISIAMLGTGVAAMLVYLRPEWFEGEPQAVLARWSGVFALALMLSPFALVRLDFAGTGTLSLSFFVHLMAACAVAAVAPFASGVVVAVAIARYRAVIGQVYAFDLVGGGLGALVVVPILGLGPAPDLMLWLGIAAAAGAVLFAGSAPWERTMGMWLAAAGAAVALLSATTSVLYLDPQYAVPDGSRRVAEHWTPLARSFGYELPGPSAVLFYDRVYAPVPVVQGPELPDWRALSTGPASIGFVITGPGHALIIGGGGGRDIYNALSSGQRPVDVIELIDSNRRVVDEDLGYLSGSPYSRDGVRTVIGDGRSILAARTTRYDQIHIGFTDTLSANAAQGFALTENNLYTLEAFDEYFDHLKPRGILNVSRLVKLVGDEALRITVLTLAALEQRGVEDPFQHVVVVLGRDLLGPLAGTVLARLTPFEPDEIERIERLAEERGSGLLMAPGVAPRREWKTLVNAESIEAFCTTHVLDVCPPSDDRPFFFHMGRLGNLGAVAADGYIYTASPMGILLVTLGVLSVLSILGFALPLLLARSSLEGARAASLVYFAAIGLGFLLFEIVLIQRLVLFLGFPTYALSVVLFALLVSSGLGSYLSERFRDPRRALTRALASAVVLLAAGAFGLTPLLGVLIDLPFAARVAISVAIVAPVGVALGMAMPLGLSRLGALEPRAVPYAWGVNGIASVLASVLGIFIATELGFTAASLAACACYGVALAHAALGRWASPS